MAYVGFHKEGAKFSLATSTHTKGAQTMFSYFFLWWKQNFFCQRGHGPMASLNMPLIITITVIIYFTNVHLFHANNLKFNVQLNNCTKMRVNLYTTFSLMTERYYDWEWKLITFPGCNQHHRRPWSKSWILNCHTKMFEPFWNLSTYQKNKNLLIMHIF